MPGKTLFELICGVLPANVEKAQLLACVEPELWERDHALACLTALRKTMNWDLYLARNPDVRDAGMEPALHFVRHGLFEGRKPYAAEPACVKIDADQPLVSVIVSNYNNEQYIGNAIDCLINQSLENIEIIVVDDCSSDASARIIREKAAADKRVKPLFFPVNKSLHMTRKIGVSMAAGRYIMFLDADDAYESAACEKAFEAINEGFDLVSFGVNVQPAAAAYAKDAAAMSKDLNRNAGMDFIDEDILRVIFNDRAFPPAIWSKIYSAPFARRAFAVMEEGNFSNGEDKYEILVLARLAKSARVIPDRLYNYRYGGGLSTATDARIAIHHRLRCTDVLDPIDRFAAANGLENYARFIRRGYLYSAMAYWARSPLSTFDGEFLRILARKYGLWNVLDVLMERHAADAPLMAEKLRNMAIEESFAKPPRHVGICRDRASGGAADQILIALMERLLQMGMRVTVFSSLTRDEFDILPAGVQLARLDAASADYNGNRKFLGQLEYNIRADPPDVMLFGDLMDARLIFLICLLKLENIPAILLHHFPFRQWFESCGKAGIDSAFRIYRALDLVICLNQPRAALMRINGIQACSLPQQFCAAAPRPQAAAPKRENIIIAYGPFMNPAKQLQDCLLILKQTLAEVPDAKLCLVNACPDANAEKRFASEIARDGLKSKISIVSASKDACQYLAAAKVLFSANSDRGLPLELLEAGAQGLPAVMYASPFDKPAAGNIISVANGDANGAAREIIRILKGHSPDVHASSGVAPSREPAPVSRYVDEIIDSFTHLNHWAKWRDYGDEDYLTLIRGLMAYGTGMAVE